MITEDFRRLGLFLISTLFALTLTACGGGGGGGTSGSGGGSADVSGLRLQITDAPVDDLYAVCINFSQAEIHPSDDSGNIFLDLAGTSDDVCTNNGANPPASGRTIDLKALTSGDAVMLLEENALDAGDYSWIRLYLNLDDTFVIVDESDASIPANWQPLDCPSCTDANSGLKLNRSFTIETTGWVDFTIDFDLRKSINMYGNPKKYRLRPTLRIIDTELASSQIAGTVVDERTPPTANPADPTGCVAYFYEGASADITPDDICEDPDTNICPEADRPLTSTGVVYDDVDMQYEFLSGFLYPGVYTVALLCENDDSTLDDDVSFAGIQEIDASTAGIYTLDPFVLVDPTMEVAKGAPTNDDADGSGSVTQGDTLTYTVTATNTGNSTLNNVVVSDALINPTETTCTTVVAGATCELVGTYAVTEDGVTEGQTSITNTGSAVSDEITTAVTSAEVVTPVSPPPAP